MFYARLKLQNPDFGHLLKRYGVGTMIFDAGTAVPVDAEMATYLRTVKQPPRHSTSPLAFDVWDPDKEDPPAEMPIAVVNREGAIMSADLTRSFVPRSELDAIVARRVSEALAARDAAMAPVVKIQSGAKSEEAKQTLPPEKEVSREKVERYFPAAEKAKK